ncbi:DDHD domain-domain-containing protein [Absidia repens]|uniref:DDHD domain-domain-containing protein n=1 Tax=Absidia repens TaxID=90262 RepID=A0A1X2IKW0_9FUNG|nr:DDHD domain-domain-containing protein [Absidia repens]
METIRKTISEVLQARMPDSDIRIQLIPIEWHKHIHEQTDGCLENISLQSIPGMRLISNDYMMDALYYLAKDRQQSIITHVTQTFNDTYHEFIDMHPTFEGNIGIFGYSLGGLITWDILAHQRSIDSLEEQAQLDKMGLDVPRLDFKPQFLFGVGCPLGAFLNIRNQNPKLYHPDSSTIFENIYHPCDPLAYRVEPFYHTDCRHHDSVHVEPGIPADPSTPLLTSLAGWVTSWFKKSEGNFSVQFDSSWSSQSHININTTCHGSPDQHPVNVNSTVSMNTPLPIATPSSNTYSTPTSPSVDCPITHLHDASQLPVDVENDGSSVGKNEEPSDRTTLLSSVGALFQYISPRASFDRDSAIGSDIDEDNEEEAMPMNTTTSHSKNNTVDTATVNKCNNSSPKNKKMSASTSTATNNNNSRSINKSLSLQGVAVNPLSDINTLYRRRQSQIYDSPQCWTQKKRHRLLSNLNSTSSISSLEQDTTLLKALPGFRRLDYELQSESMFGGMVSNQYLIGLHAHFSYWNNKDMLWRMVDQLEKALH